MSFWNGRRVLVAGGTGFIGSFLTERLINRGARVRVVARNESGLRNLASYKSRFEFVKADLHSIDACRAAARGMDTVFNLAAKVGGVGYNINHHATMFTENTVLNTNLVEASHLENVERYQCTSSTCVYQRHCTIPSPEEEGFDGEPEPANLGYGWSKRMSELQAQFYAKEHGMKISIVRPANAYGPRDDFDPETAHVVPALIRRVFESTDKMVVWGSGKQTRGFIYVEDVADGMIETLEKYPIADPLNIATDEEVTIEYLIRTIMEISGKHLPLEFDATKPEGQPRKNASNQKIREKTGWYPKVKLKEGLTQTIDWYNNNVLRAAA